MLILTIIILLIASIYDIKYRKIPNALIAILLLIGIVSFVCNDNRIPQLVGLVLPLVLLIPYALGKTGAGDIKLLISTGFILGAVPNTVIFIFSLLLALFCALILTLLRRRPTSDLPYAPFFLGSLIVLLLFTYLLK